MNITKLILNDPSRMVALKCVEQLKLPDCFVAAGFVRNAVWDFLHGFERTPLNDVDVIYFDSEKRFDDSELEQQLRQRQPDIRWQVKNQAIMHLRNGDLPYSCSTHAMQFWPEKETAVGVRSFGSDSLALAAPFGCEFLFQGKITHNPARARAIFEQRVSSKGWLTTWPQLELLG